MLDILRRESVYIWYYFSIQLEQIFRYWIFGMMIGSVISVFAKDKIHKLFDGMRDKKLGLFGIIPACILGILSPLCMYGTIPIAASFSEKGMRDDWLAAFMMTSILLNPQLMIYSAALGGTALIIRLASCFLCGAAAGLLVFFCFRGKPFFNFSGFAAPHSRDTDPNLALRLLKNFGRNVKATGPIFLLGVLMAATVGVPLYACGGGTIPLLQQWLLDGMSMGSAAAFMITGPATKITNLGAVKIVLGMKHFIFYIAFVMLFSLLSGMLVNLVI